MNESYIQNNFDTTGFSSYLKVEHFYKTLHEPKWNKVKKHLTLNTWKTF